jgi:hypothetical protein
MIIPDWFKDNFVDIEQLLIDMARKIFPDMPEGQIGLWEPDDWLDEPDPEPLLTFIRLPGGQVCWDKNYDECLIQATVVTGDRTLSNRAMSLIRGVLLSMQGTKFTMNDGYTAQIHEAEEVSGPELLTHEQQVDLRVVPATFRVRVGLRNRTRYNTIISGL